MFMFITRALDIQSHRDRQCRIGVTTSSRGDLKAHKSTTNYCQSFLTRKKATETGNVAGPCIIGAVSYKLQTLVLCRRHPTHSDCIHTGHSQHFHVFMFVSIARLQCHVIIFIIERVLFDKTRRKQLFGTYRFPVRRVISLR